MNRRDGLIQELTKAQRPDGGFGRFHSMDSKAKRKIPTTEHAAWLMYDNAFTRDDGICGKACVYMEQLLGDLATWPDAWEKNKWFRPAVPLFIASKLALFGSEDGNYKTVRDIWLGLCIAAFGGGAYSAEALNARARLALGVEIDGSYIGFHSINNLALCALNARDIPPGTQRAYLRWLHSYDGEIMYTKTRPRELSGGAADKRVISLLSRFDGFAAEFDLTKRSM